MELRMYCQRCFVRYVLRTVSTAAVAVVLPFAVGRRIIVYVLPEFYILTEQRYYSCRQLPCFLWDPHPYSHTPTSTFSHRHLPLASRHDRLTS